MFEDLKVGTKVSWLNMEWIVQRYLSSTLKSPAVFLKEINGNGQYTLTKEEYDLLKYPPTLIN